MNLLISDYDQTLSMDDITLKINLKKVEEFRNQGNIFMLSTGRDYTSIKAEIKKYNIPYDYISCNNGISLYNSDDKLIEYHYLDKNDLRYSNYLKLKYNDTINITDISSNINDLIDYRVIEIKDIHYKDIMLEIEKYFKQYLQFSDYLIKYNCIYLIRKNTNKSTPIKFLEDRFRLSKENIFTIGDNDNDSEMIHDYNGFTMLWGSKKAQQYALKKYLLVAQLIYDITNYNDSFQKILRYKL